MDVDTWMWIIGQTIMLAMVVVGAFMRVQVSIAKLEGKVEVLTVQQALINKAMESNDVQHKSLAEKVDGISRGLARVEGMEMGRQHEGAV